MKYMQFSIQMVRRFFLTVMLLSAAFATAQAQATGTVIPSVCFEAKTETLTRMLTNNLTPGAGGGSSNQSPVIDQAAPLGFYTIVYNPGGATQEVLSARIVENSGTRISFGSGVPENQTFLYSHAAGETMHLISVGDAVYGYNNTSDAALTIPRGILTRNYFIPGATIYPNQPMIFHPGIHQDVMRLKMTSVSASTWFLNGGEAAVNPAAGQSCANINYQGRLSDSGIAANGQYDLQFQMFDTENGGAAQSDLITIENVQVTNGIFTVSLFLGASLTGNQKARFLQIGVRPGVSTDAFSILTPRQPITDSPFAVNAQRAFSVSGGFVQLPLTSNTPPSFDCDQAAEYGQTRVDAVNNKLYICTSTGWKSTVLQ
ncbi:MAG TPA: hypothetical protein PKY59_17230 [Pyrinomonadaceae bacterium]|nr:hypothetical protein [Pyrinomonadaceae bacterium]